MPEKTLFDIDDRLGFIYSEVTRGNYYQENILLVLTLIKDMLREYPITVKLSYSDKGDPVEVLARLTDVLNKQTETLVKIESRLAALESNQKQM